MKNALIVYPQKDIGEGRTLTLAAEVHPGEGYNAVTFGIALRNPTDQESKPELGVLIAKGRAHKNSTFSLFTTGQSISRSFVDKVAAVLMEEVGSKVRNYVPFSERKKAEVPAV
jgi:hypothetical protein